MRFYYAMNPQMSRVCPHLPLDEAERRAIRGNTRAGLRCDDQGDMPYSWQCVHDDDNATWPQHEFMIPHCTNGAVVSLYNTAGKARAQVRSERGYVMWIDLPEDGYRVGDPAPLSQRMEARMLSIAERLQAQERAEAEALTAPPKKTRKKKAAT